MADGEKVIFEIEVQGTAKAVDDVQKVEDKIKNLSRTMTAVVKSPSTILGEGKGRKSSKRSGGTENESGKPSKPKRKRRIRNPNAWISDAVESISGNQAADELKKAFLASRNSKSSGNEHRGISGLLGYSPPWAEIKDAFQKSMQSLWVGYRGNKLVPSTGASLIGGQSVSRDVVLSAIFGQMAESIIGNDYEWSRGYGRRRTEGRSGSWASSATIDVTPQEGGNNNNRGRGGSFWDRFTQYVPGGREGGMVRGALGKLGASGAKILGVVGALLGLGAAFALLGHVVNALITPFKALKAAADDVFRFYRTRHLNGGMQNGELSRFGLASMITGADANEGGKLLTRISSERASLLWGGDGGSYLEAASRFGVDLRGSGHTGLATNEEWLRAIAARMSELDPEGKLALANSAGLNREQFWMTSHGAGYYDYVTSRRTMAQQAWGGLIGEDIYSDHYQSTSQDLSLDWGIFMQNFKELMGMISEVLIPIINLILEILSGIFMAINFVLKPITSLIGTVLSWFNLSHWANKNAMEDDVVPSNLSDFGILRLTKGWGNNTVSINEMNINSNATDGKDVAQEVIAQLNTAWEDIYLSKAGGEEFIV